MVLDKESNKPIPYVNISILESTVGTSSDDDGSYTLHIKNEDLSKNVKLSSLGYNDTTIVVSNFIKLDKVRLTPLVEQLDEVVISEKFEEKTMIVNEILEEDLCAGYGSHAENPWIVALYFPFISNYEDTDFLKSVRFHFGNFKNKKGKFRLRLFSVGNDSLPDQDLMKENVIVSLKKNQKTVDVDISECSLIFPREGFYIAIEWLYIPYNEQKIVYVDGPKNKNKRKGIKYSPTISATCEEEGKYKVAVYNSGVWSSYLARAYKKEGQWIPAISLTLSN